MVNFYEVNFVKHFCFGFSDKCTDIDIKIKVCVFIYLFNIYLSQLL